MEFHEYLVETRRTINKDLNEKETVINLIMGLVGESGEIVEVTKKAIFHKKSFDRKFEKEIGDYLWYLARIFDTLELHKFYNEIIISPLGIEKNQLAINILKLSFKTNKFAKSILSEGYRNNKQIIFTQWLSLYNYIHNLEYLDLDIRQLFTDNIAKLKLRYPDGFVSHSNRADLT